MSEDRLPLRITRRAAREISKASAWWAAELIATYPGVGARALNAELSGIRRVHLSRVRHHLYYRVSSKAVEILALWHTGRRTEPGV